MNLKHPTEDLVLSAQKGDTAAFETLAEQNFGLVYSIALARLATREAAEDLSQEVMLRAYLALGHLREPQYFATWLARIARNLAEDWARREQRSSTLMPLLSLEEHPVDVQDDRTSEETWKRMDRERINLKAQESIMALPPEQREVVLLHYVEEMSLREIAERLEVHPTSVGRRLQAGLVTLRKSMDPVLRESAQALRPHHAAVRRAAGIAGAMAAAPAATQAAIVQSITTTASTSPTAGELAATFSSASAGSSCSIPTAALSAGGKIMATKKVAAIAAGIITLFTGTALYQSARTSTPSSSNLVVNTAMASSPDPASLKSIEGIWMGTLEIARVKKSIRAVFHIQRGTDGALYTTIDSPDEGGRDLPAEQVSFDGTNFRMRINYSNGTYEARLVDGELRGAYREDGEQAAMPLNMKKVDRAPIVPNPAGDRKAVALSADILDSVSGTYAMGSNSNIVITRQGERLGVKIGKQGSLPYEAEDANRYFSRNINSQLLFERDGSGKPFRVTLLQDGKRTVARKIR